MKVHAKNVAWLLTLVLPISLTGCLGKTNQTQNQQFAPPVSTVPKPPALHPTLPEEAVTLPTVALDTDTDKILEEAAKPAFRRRRIPAKPPAPEVTENAPPAASAPPAADDGEVPAIGDLTSGEAVSSDRRRETADSIADTERGLKGIGRPLNSQEQKTVAQIRQFVHQARKALVSGDVDGAYTLALKAKVLLGELND